MPHLSIVWLPNAILCIQRAYIFLVEKDTDAAKAAIATIRKHVTILKQFPNAGCPAEDLEPEHRELLIPFGGSGYVLLYRLEHSKIFILAVRHQKEIGY
jgi:toxin ParE1/3/4